jgi:hypothetical protein
LNDVGGVTDHFSVKPAMKKDGQTRSGVSKMEIRLNRLPGGEENAMMKKIMITRLIVGAVVALAMTMGLLAVERGTPAEAKAMLEKEVAHYKAVGRRQALANFTGRKTPFFDRDLYVVCIGSDGIVTAHGGFPAFNL